MEKDKSTLIAIDFDKTIAFYDRWVSADDTGAPIPAAVAMVKERMAQGEQFVIFTARVNPGDGAYERALDATKAFLAIAAWCQTNLGVLLPITCVKSPHWKEIIDDRARQIAPNLGVFVTDLLDAARKQQ